MRQTTEGCPEGCPAEGRRGSQYLLAFSCKGRWFCPSCHQKKAQLFGALLAETVLAPVPHRHFTFTIPKMRRPYFRFHRGLIKELCRIAHRCLAEFQRTTLGLPEGTTGVVMAIHTFGEYLDFHPHLHALAADGLFVDSGLFHVMPDVSLAPLEELFRARVITFLLKKGLLPPERARWGRARGRGHRRLRVQAPPDSVKEVARNHQECLGGPRAGRCCPRPTRTRRAGHQTLARRSLPRLRQRASDSRKLTVPAAARSALGARIFRPPTRRALDSQSPIWQRSGVEITASSFKPRANAPEGRKAISYQHPPQTFMRWLLARWRCLTPVHKLLIYRFLALILTPFGLGSLPVFCQYRTTFILVTMKLKPAGGNALPRSKQRLRRRPAVPKIPARESPSLEWHSTAQQQPSPVQQFRQ